MWVSRFSSPTGTRGEIIQGIFFEVHDWDFMNSTIDFMAFKYLFNRCRTKQAASGNSKCRLAFLKFLLDVLVGRKKNKCSNQLIRANLIRDDENVWEGKLFCGTFSKVHMMSICRCPHQRFGNPRNQPQNWPFTFWHLTLLLRATHEVH